MQDNLYRADFREDQSVAVQPHAIPVLRVRDTVVSSFAFETGKASFFSATLHPLEEGLIGQINSHGDVLKDVRVNAFLISSSSKREALPGCHTSASSRRVSHKRVCVQQA